MAFQTSASAFGMKPTVNTGFGAFGSAKPPGQTTTFGASQQPSGFGAFGQLGAQSQQNQNQNQPQGSNLFGSSFGQPQQQQSQAPPSTNLFGQPAGAQQQQQPSQNLFGGGAFSGNTTGLNQNTQNTGAQPTQSTNLFGNLGANTGQQQQSQPQTTGFGAFGAAKPATAPAWGATGNTAPNALGSSTNFGTGSSIFGQSQLQQQPLSLSTTSQQVVSPPLFTRNTKFNDLPEDVKKVFENIDSQIQGRVQICNDLKQRKLGEEPDKGTEEIRIVHKDLVHVINELRTDISLTRSLKNKMDQAVQDIIVSTRIIDGFRNPQQHGAHLKNHVNFPLEYFTRVTEQLKERLQWFTKTIEQIERKITAEAGHVSVTPQAITSTLQAQHAVFIALANKTATVDAELQKLKATYTQLWRAATGSARDPFNNINRGGDLGDFGIESLRVS